jgi:putative membrane protein
MKPIPPLLLPLALLAATAAHAATATPADRAFVGKVSQGGMFEVNAGKLASAKGSTQDIRDFAAMELHDHMLVGDKLKTLSAGEGITIAIAPNAEFAGKLKTLQGLSGAAFDEAYMMDMATLHDADGAAFLKESAGGGSPAFRAFGAETHRIVQRHIGAIHGANPVG